jgi:hypothetical protein
MQLPSTSQTFLDHLALFVDDMEAAATALERIGFLLTPLTRQMNQENGRQAPAGTANRCAMFESGYLEILTAVEPTPLSARLKAAVGRYRGLHLVAYAAGDLEAATRRLEDGGFDPDAPVRLRRSVELPDSAAGEAAFTVIRVPPEKMPEGRIQMLAHHTEALVWQPRFLGHPNGVTGLASALLVVADPDEAAARFQRFAGGRLSRPTPTIRRLDHDRGALAFASVRQVGDVLPVAPESVAAPWIAAMALETCDLDRAVAHFVAGDLRPVRSDGARALFELPSALGGWVELLAPGSAASWLG